METTKRKSRAGSPNKTWCGVPISLYRRKKAELSKEEFREWWLKKTGRPLCLRDEKKPKQESGWSAVRRLQKKIADQEKTILMYQQIVIQKNDYITALENRSWISRLFNSKV